MLTAPKLIYVAKGLSMGGYHHDDVMQFSTVVSPKPCLSVEVSSLPTCQLNLQVPAGPSVDKNPKSSYVAYS